MAGGVNFFRSLSEPKLNAVASELFGHVIPKNELDGNGRIVGKDSVVVQPKVTNFQPQCLSRVYPKKK